MSYRIDEFGGDVQLDVSSVGVKVETKAVDDVTEGTKHQILGDAL